MPLPIQPTSSPQPMSVKNSAHLLAPTFSQTMTSPWKKRRYIILKTAIVTFLWLWEVVVAQLWYEDRGKALQAWKKLCCVCLERDSSKKVCPTFGQKPQTFPPWGGRRPLLKSQQRANSELSTRAKTVNRGKHHRPERASNENNWNSILRSTHIRNT